MKRCSAMSKALAKHRLRPYDGDSDGVWFGVWPPRPQFGPGTPAVN